MLLRRVDQALSEFDPAPADYDSEDARGLERS